MRDKILTDLFKSKEFNDCISKMKPEHLQDDLKGEVLLILCEMEEGKLMDLHYKGVLRFYTVRTILNLIQSTTSPFYKKFRNPVIDIYGSDTEGGFENSKRDRLDRCEGVGYNEIKTLTAIDEVLSRLNEIDKVFLDGYFDERLYDEKKNELRLMEVFNLFWYDKEMILLYLDHGNYRAIQKETKIDHVSAYKSIKKAIKQIDEAVDLRMLKDQPYSPSEIMGYIARADRMLAIEYLNNVLEYFKSSYSAELIAEFNLKIQEKEYNLKKKLA